MKRLNVAIVDLVTNKPTRALYSRFMNANLAGLMAQAVAVWCEELGHDVRYLCFTGAQDILREVGDEVDIVFIGAFTRSAHTAYALSSHFRSKGAVTILGGPQVAVADFEEADLVHLLLGLEEAGFGLVQRQIFRLA
jgi:hypothetical protein